MGVGKIEVNSNNIEDCFPFETFRRDQKEALCDIVNLLESDKDLIILDAPTGFGKSPVNIALGRYFKPTFYTTPQVKLVNQISKDFCPNKLAIDGGIGDTIALLGRRNYNCKETNRDCDICPIRDGLKGIDVNGKNITRYCPNEENCTYWKQKEQASEADIAILTFAMLIANSYVQGFSPRNLLIVDECHSLESQVAGMFAGFTLSPKVLPNLSGVDLVDITDSKNKMWKEIEKVLPKSSRVEDYVPFFKEKFLIISKNWRLFCKNERERDKLDHLTKRISYMLHELDEGRKWVVDLSGSKRRRFKPILVDRFLQRKVWSQANKIILSSATIPFRNNIKAWLKRLGLEDKKYYFHSIPMRFPLQNRQIITSYMGGKMTRNNENLNWKGNVRNIKQIIGCHKGEKGVIHTQSYQRAIKLHNDLKGCNTFLHDRIKVEGDIIEVWIDSNKQILISPSIKDGVDLKDDLCRFQIILKIPFPNIKDPRVDYLLNKRNEWTWYYNEAITDTVQIYGRAVRSKEDYAKLYIIDGSFRNLKTKGFPKWFLDAIID